MTTATTTSLQPRSHGLFISQPIFPYSLWGVDYGNEVDPRVPYDKQRIHKIIMTFLWFKQACSLKSTLFDKASLICRLTLGSVFKYTKRMASSLSPFNNIV